MDKWELYHRRATDVQRVCSGNPGLVDYCMDVALRGAERGEEDDTRIGLWIAHRRVDYARINANRDLIAARIPPMGNAESPEAIVVRQESANAFWRSLGRQITYSALSVAYMLAEGYSAAQVADNLGVTRQTVWRDRNVIAHALCT